MDNCTNEVVVFLIADPASIGSSTAEFDLLIPTLESASKHPLRVVRVDFPQDGVDSEIGRPLNTLLELYKEHSVSSGLNFLVGQGFGGILALRLTSIFTRNSIGGLLLLSCPFAPSPVGNWPLEGAARLLLTAHSSKLLSPFEGCLRQFLWPQLVKREVTSRYLMADSAKRSGEGVSSNGDAKVVQIAVDRALARAYTTSSSSHLARLRRCVQPISPLHGEGPGSSHESSSSSSSGPFLSWATLRLAQPRISLVYGAAHAADAPKVAAALGLPAANLEVVEGAGRQVVEERPKAVETELWALVEHAIQLEAARQKRYTSSRSSRSINPSEAPRAVTTSSMVSDPDDYATF